MQPATLESVIFETECRSSKLKNLKLKNAVAKSSQLSDDYRLPKKATGDSLDERQEIGLFRNQQQNRDHFSFRHIKMNEINIRSLD